MKIAFTAPIFHSNQEDLVKGLITDGYSVDFLVYQNYHYVDSKFIKPMVMNQMDIFKLFCFIYKKINYNKSKRFKKNYFLPSITYVLKYLIHSKPDVVIARKSKYNSSVWFVLSKLTGIKNFIQYDQVPKLSDKKIHFKYKLIGPKTRVTPVLYRNCQEIKVNNSYMVDDSRAHYLPFVIDTKKIPKSRTYFDNERINILTVARFVERKNLLYLINIIEKIKSINNFNWTFVGTVSDNEYFNQIKKTIDINKLNGKIKLVTEVPHSQINKYYLSHDVLVLASKKEPASYAILEAKAYGLVAISTTCNGTAHYIQNNIDGFIYDDVSVYLEKVLVDLIKNKTIIPKMGKKAMKDVQINYSYSTFHNTFIDLIK